MNCSPGDTPRSTRSPSASSVVRLTKRRTTRRFTSASSSATLISRTASWMFFSVTWALPETWRTTSPDLPGQPFEHRSIDIATGPATCQRAAGAAGHWRLAFANGAVRGYYSRTSVVRRVSATNYLVAASLAALLLFSGCTRPGRTGPDRRAPFAVVEAGQEQRSQNPDEAAASLRDVQIRTFNQLIETLREHYVYGEHHAVPWDDLESRYRTKVLGLIRDSEFPDVIREMIRELPPDAAIWAVGGDERIGLQSTDLPPLRGDRGLRGVPRHSHAARHSVVGDVRLAGRTRRVCATTTVCWRWTAFRSAARRASRS